MITPTRCSISDPPYRGGENGYGKLMFERADYQRMADLLRELKGRFILSINCVPEIREVFDGFYMEAVQLKYSISAGGSTEASELIVMDREVVTGLL